MHLLRRLGHSGLIYRTPAGLVAGGSLLKHFFRLIRDVTYFSLFQMRHEVASAYMHQI